MHFAQFYIAIVNEKWSSTYQWSFLMIFSPVNIKVDTNTQYNEHGEMARYWRQLKVLENLCHYYLTEWLKWYEYRCLQMEV